MKFKVVYETINGNTKTVSVESKNIEDAEVKVYYTYPDCFRVISVR